MYSSRPHNQNYEPLSEHNRGLLKLHSTEVKVTGLEPHEGKWMITKFLFWGELLPLKWKLISNSPFKELQTSWKSSKRLINNQRRGWALGGHTQTREERELQMFSKEKKFSRELYVRVSLSVYKQKNLLHPSRQNVIPPACVMKCICLKHLQTPKIKYNF